MPHAGEFTNLHALMHDYQHSHLPYRACVLDSADHVHHSTLQARGVFLGLAPLVGIANAHEESVRHPIRHILGASPAEIRVAHNARQAVFIVGLPCARASLNLRQRTSGTKLNDTIVYVNLRDWRSRA